MKFTRQYATAEEALAEANEYIKVITKAMRSLLRDPPDLSIQEARDSLNFPEVPVIQFCVHEHGAPAGPQGFASKLRDIIDHQQGMSE